MSWTESLGQKLSTYAKEEFEYLETTDITDVSKLDYGISGLYMEATVVFVEIKNVPYILKEHGRRKLAQAYTMVGEVLTAIAQQTGAFVNCYSPSAFLVVYPGKEETKQAVISAMKISQALSDTYKSTFDFLPGFEFAMGMDHGHILGTKLPSDNGLEHISWFGTCILKANKICNECARPFYLGVSGSIYHSLGEELRTTQRRILGIKKSVDIWTKVTYQFENVKKHLYQTNHKISLEEA